MTRRDAGPLQARVAPSLRPAKAGCKGRTCLTSAQTIEPGHTDAGLPSRPLRKAGRRSIDQRKGFVRLLLVRELHALMESMAKKSSLDYSLA